MEKPATKAINMTEQNAQSHGKPLPSHADGAGYRPIGDYGIIGDLHTVALVSTEACIDFMCFPFFDSPSIFCALLDNGKGGFFSLSPRLKEVQPKQFYLPDTNILLSRYLSHDGVAEISDFMVVDEREKPGHQLVRRAKAVRGDIEFTMECRPRFDYARAPHHARQLADNAVAFESNASDGLKVRLIATVPLMIDDKGDATATFLLRKGETALFIFEQADGENEEVRTNLEHASASFKSTLNYWQNWVRRMKYQGRWREMVARSALLLKLLTFRPTGALVAAPTFGLPETIGGERNWDYRYTWIRDASFTIYALIRLGYTEEAGNFMGFIEERCRELADGAELQIMYGIDGRKDLNE
ncbi:MAG: glycoside hydrolase family 15 protein, partial [Candidatus Sumerlaeota bacterium]